ncbi:MAG: T9SS type A sorting domain-containing protein, partial [Bacteroidales bacterium]|nr:T9SS type A sorting domain-containing protein [Bacteroidales bacterium]
IKKGMFEKALTVLSEMEQIALSSENTSKLNDIKLNTIKIDILQNINTEPIVDIVKKYEEFLTELASDYNTKEGGVARAILESAGLMENFPIVFLPNPEGEISTKSAFIEPQEEDRPIVNYELESLFKLYPNPANDYLSVEFINPNGNCTFNIYSIKGELLKTISSNQQIGFISIDISNLSPGNYIINCPELQSKINFVVAR